MLFSNQTQKKIVVSFLILLGVACQFTNYAPEYAMGLPEGI